MKKPPKSSAHASRLRAPVLPARPESILRFVTATYKQHGGPEHMHLDHWRALEEEIKRKMAAMASFPGPKKVSICGQLQRGRLHQVLEQQVQ